MLASDGVIFFMTGGRLELCFMAYVEHKEDNLIPSKLTRESEFSLNTATTATLTYFPKLLALT